MDKNYALDSITDENIMDLIEIGKNVTIEYQPQIQKVMRQLVDQKIGRAGVSSCKK
jgi:hypothetical protein